MYFDNNNAELMVLSLLPYCVQAHSHGDYPSTALQYDFTKHNSQLTFQDLTSMLHCCILMHKFTSINSHWQ